MATEIRFDANVYTKEALLATAYWCADRVLAEILSAGSFFVVRLSLPGGKDVDQALAEEFQTMAVHNQIRHQLKKAFGDLEKVIVEKAFSPIHKA